jgi:hypothetical protein
VERDGEAYLWGVDSYTEKHVDAKGRILSCDYQGFFTLTGERDWLNQVASGLGSSARF